MPRDPNIAHRKFEQRRAAWTIDDQIISFFLRNKVIVVLMTISLAVWGVMVAPFDWDLGDLPRFPVSVDAIPDIGENQQIVFTDWPGRSPQDVEDQITYPLTVSLLGIPGVKTIRSYSNFGFSTVLIIFKEEIEFYWSRSRIIEKLNSLPPGTLPEKVVPALGPDATGLGQIFWYTLEGRDADGQPAGGWDLHELRSVQDWQVRYALLSAEGVSEVASIGGFVQEYQIDVDPDAMRAFNVTLPQVFHAVMDSNVDVGARTIEVNQVEYMVRGLGFIENISDIEKIAVAVNDNVPVSIKDIGTVSRGPAFRRGILDKEGAEAVGGVVVARFGANPLDCITNVKAKIEEIAPSLPTRVIIDEELVSREEVDSFTRELGFLAWDGPSPNHSAWLEWLRDHPTESPPWLSTSQITIVPFYDRSGLIHETLGTLSDALSQEILITIIVVLLMITHFRSSLLVTSVLPLAVLMSFIAMKLFHVDANIVALSGIAIAIGTVVDMGIIMCENVLRHVENAREEDSSIDVVYSGATEVGGAVMTAVTTTVIGFLPVFTMTGPEGKLFKPLAFTKTFALIASVIIALTILPAFAHMLFVPRRSSRRLKVALLIALMLAGLVMGIALAWWVGAIVIAVASYHLVQPRLPKVAHRVFHTAANLSMAGAIAFLLTRLWMPLGQDAGAVKNLIFVGGMVALLIGSFRGIILVYPAMLRWSLRHKFLYLWIPVGVVVFGVMAWRGAEWTFGFVPRAVESAGRDSARVYESSWWASGSRLFPGFGKEFMPDFDEGSFLFMPITMPHASVGEALSIIQYQDAALAAIPEIDSVVGKLGRVDSALDPAPISMIETVVNYLPEYRTDEKGKEMAFRPYGGTGPVVADASGRLFADDGAGEPIPVARGRPFRLWRAHIDSPDDIWQEIITAAKIPGTTSASKLQPIKARLIMLQSGMRAPMGIKVKGPDLETIEAVGLKIERLLREVPGVEPSTVYADRIVGKPYLEIDIDREAIARYGLHIRDVQDVIEVAVGGKTITHTVEGRERYPVRVRYMRELRDQIESLDRILVAAPDGTQIPLIELAEIRYVRGPQAIKSEDTFLLGYVLFDKKDGYAEVDVVEASKAYLDEHLDPVEGVSLVFAGNYENQIRAQRTLNVVLPLALFLIFIILYFHFRSVTTTLIVFMSIFVAWSGGFIIMWLYAQPWFLDWNIAGQNLRDVFQIQPINMSVAVWVGFLALFGIASDNGVVIATYLGQNFAQRNPTTREEMRDATVEAGKRRVRPCLLTTATTMLALLPVLTSTGKGSNIMVPMAIPSFGGMAIQLITLFFVPVIYCWVQETRLRFQELNQGDT